MSRSKIGSISTVVSLFLILLAGCSTQESSTQESETTIANLSARIADETIILQDLQSQLVRVRVLMAQNPDAIAKIEQFREPIAEIQARIDKHNEWKKRNKYPESFAAENVDQMIKEANQELVATIAEREEALEEINQQYTTIVASLLKKIELQERLIDEAEQSRNRLMAE